MPIPRCQDFLVFLNVALALNVCAITSLFTLRLCAVYNMAKWVTITFTILWLGGVGLLIRFVQSFRAAHIGTSGFCQELLQDSFIGPVLALLLCNDCLIFSLITYRVYRVYLETGAPTSTRFNTLCFGTSVPFLTKALLQDSQIYCVYVY